MNEDQGSNLLLRVKLFSSDACVIFTSGGSSQTDDCTSTCQRVRNQCKQTKTVCFCGLDILTKTDRILLNVCETGS